MLLENILEKKEIRSLMTKREQEEEMYVEFKSALKTGYTLGKNKGQEFQVSNVGIKGQKVRKRGL